MTLTLELTPEQERRVREEAASQGLDTQSYILTRLLGESPKTEESVSEDRARQIAAAREGYGKFAHLPGGSSYEFIAEKQREIEREDRF